MSRAFNSLAIHHPSTYPPIRTDFSHNIFLHFSAAFCSVFPAAVGGDFPCPPLLLLIAFAHAHNFPVTMQRPKKTQACKKWGMKEKECSSSAFLRRHLGGWEGQSRMDQAPFSVRVPDPSQDPFPYPQPCPDLLHKKRNFLCALWSEEVSFNLLCTARSRHPQRELTNSFVLRMGREPNMQIAGLQMGKS